MDIKTVVITGVTGFFGSALARKLVSKGIKVYGVGRSFDKISDLSADDNFTPIKLEFEQYDELTELIDHDQVDVFFHFAWAGGFTNAITDYSLQMDNAARAGDAIGVAIDIGAKRFVYAGTYNQFEIANVLGSASLTPRNTCIYACGKAAGDIICRTIANDGKIEYCSGLVSMPYGENNRSMQLVNVVLKSLIEGRSPKLITGDNPYDLVYIDDVADAFIAIAEHGHNMKGYYVGHRDLKTFRELMERIRDIVAPNVELLFGEYADNQQLDYSMIDLDALKKDAGFECKADFDQTILSTAEWVKYNL